MSSLSLLWVGSNVEVVAGQSLLDAGGWFLGPVGSVSPEPVVVAVLAVGFVGMSIKSVFDSILSDEDAGDSSEDADDDGLMPEEGGDEFGDLGGLDEGGDEFGEFGDDEFGGDEFGDMDGGPDTDELEHRLDELETEVGSLSSTVNTVRNENEQISETVDDVEENVRKLLDIYEMVTRGVNPFADDIDAGGLGGPGEQSFGLFDDGGGDEADEELEEGIANADAEGFFDEDLVEDDDEMETDTDVGDMLGDESGSDEDEVAFDDEFDEDFEDVDDGFDEDFEDDFEMDDDDTEGDSGGESGKSFAELKDEYESGDAEWAEGREDADDPVEEDVADEGFDTDDAGDAIEEMETEAADDALADDDLFDTVIEDEGTAVEAEDDAETFEATDDETSEAPDEPAVEADDTEDLDEDGTDDADIDVETADEPGMETETESVDPKTASAETETVSRDASETENATDTDDGKPYLTELPDGFLADLIVVEWLEFLVSEVGVRATAEAIHYYERIDWIDDEVAEQLQAYLRGFEDGGDATTLTIDHHTKSLRYVSQLNGGGAESVALDQIPATVGGGSDGIQR
ncbi:FlaD/FlaE family flagellar protein [Halorhabdus rudnickae]|uniref:FlaD/FlaE family flagellar protein n=1 Tax=Halorhabdus rudnickae TaxID=1775544 RepID=UPI001082669E|nr:FlaD/FlaE family flagellar protein [Halorhabdus rudnickae]